MSATTLPSLQSGPRPSREGVDDKSRHTVEVTDVPCHNLVVSSQGGTGNQEIGGRNPLARSTEPAVDLAEYPHDRERDGYDRYGSDDCLHKLLASSAPRGTVGSPATVEQLVRTHDGHRQLDLAEPIRQVGDELFRRPAPTLRVHEECRVDQESHDGGSSMDSPARMSRKSVENSSSKSTGERPRRRAMHSETVRLETGFAR